MLTSEEKIKILRKLICHHQGVDEVFDKVEKSLGVSFSESSDFYNTVWTAIEMGIEAVSAFMGDESNWLTWHIYDNDCGKNHLEAGYDGKRKKICSVKDLLELIEEGQKR